MIRHNTRYQIFLAASDAVIVCLCLALASALRLNIDIGAEGGDGAFVTPPVLYPIAVGIWLAAFQQAGVYRATLSMRFRPTSRRVVAGHILACLLFLGILYIGFRDYSRVQAIYFFVLTLIAILGYRLLVRLLRQRLRPILSEPRRVLIVGLSPAAIRIGQLVVSAARGTLTLAGYLSDGAGEVSPEAPTPLGSVDEAAAIVRREQVQEVIVAVRWYDQAAAELVTRLMHVLDDQPVSIRLAADYSDLAYFQATSDYIEGMILVGLREPVLTPFERIVKRAVDIAISGLVLLLTWPLFVLIALAVRRDSPGPAIFRQERVGQHGRTFTMLKFRTMVPDADAFVDHDNGDDAIKRPDDPRVTRVGRFLRRTSLDELPQFINVLRGDMSIVGPRPEMPWLTERYEWWQRKRFEVPQGLTGWWQVTGRADKPMHLSTEDDLYYVTHYSIWLDFWIMLRTIAIVFTGRGAY